MTTERIRYGALAGLVGGLVFGMMMHVMGMIEMVGALVVSESAAAGWVVHMVNSAIIGAIYGAMFGQLHHTVGRGAGLGMLYGVVWWIVGGLFLMPLLLGMPVFQLGQPQLMSLVGHLVYGLLTGLVSYRLAQAPVGPLEEPTERTSGAIGAIGAVAL